MISRDPRIEGCRRSHHHIGEVAATAPISGALLAIAVAAAPNTTSSFPPADADRAARSASRSRRCVRVVDDDVEVLTCVHRLELPGTDAAGGETVGETSRADQGCAALAAARLFHALNAPPMRRGCAARGHVYS